MCIRDREVSSAVTWSVAVIWSLITTPSAVICVACSIPRHGGGNCIIRVEAPRTLITEDSVEAPRAVITEDRVEAPRATITGDRVIAPRTLITKDRVEAPRAMITENRVIAPRH